jgi:hypothetical protein
VEFIGAGVVDCGSCWYVVGGWLIKIMRSSTKYENEGNHT